MKPAHPLSLQPRPGDLADRLGKFAKTDVPNSACKDLLNYLSFLLLGLGTIRPQCTFRLLSHRLPQSGE